MKGQPYKKREDYISLRECPLFFNSIKKQYLVISTQFLLDKLYQSLLFRLSQSENKDKGSEYHKFCSKIGADFFECILFYDTISYYFKSTDIKFSGKQISDKGIKKEGADFYARRGNQILLFEVKNYSMQTKISLSNDYEKIRDWIMDKLGEKAGVSQLYKNVEKIYKGEYKKIDSEMTIDQLEIYPILVVGDCYYSTDGVNYLLAQKFELLNQNKYNCKKMVTIHIDTLILYQDYFKEGKYDLIDCINSYLKYIQKGINALHSFENYILYYHKLGCESAKSIKDFCDIYNI